MIHYLPTINAILNFTSAALLLFVGILIPHSILAGIMVPFIIMAIYFALRGKFDNHRRLVRWIWPVWMFVSVTGIIVYLMLYHL